ncbi:thrombospondin-type laminin G domain and EAR repeat-containing protein-like [Myxocyprinus asiaticus]|uniref:thrombospondin-type laminin G domain and EAR repeat-containing protein-like n=1 Tax=Myxocyprinus asiaticus TaxID=70543 RepID=UPI002221D38C|nr:thrombospondin-type laminin G domain and EAR repeat-containing protein-like [Myxocyprinus asiaticus]
MSELPLLACVLLSWIITCQSGPWRPCTDLLPLDLLSRGLPAAGKAQDGIRMVQSRGVRGFQFSGSPQLFSFPASQLFINCNFFPAEFSIIVTLKIPQMAPEKSEYIFSLLEGDSDELLLGLRLSQNKLHFLQKGQGSRKRITFKAVSLADNRWHTLVLAVTEQYTILTVDCGIPLEIVLDSPFPDDLDTAGSTFFIASRRRWNSLFSGMMRQLVLLPGSDATSKICPSSEPHLSALSVPQALLHLPIKPFSTDLPFYSYEAEVQVTAGVSPSCGHSEEGQLWFNTLQRGLFLCDGIKWLTLLQVKERLDYVEDHQELFTNSETFDIEVFQIPSVGLFIATANRDSNLGSGIYKWTDGKFERYQNISTYDAQAWQYFTVGKKKFLAVANCRGMDIGDQEQSIIYKWSSRKLKFIQYQTLNTFSARDWEAFHIQDEAFLAVANHRQGERNHNIDSVIYKWNPITQFFEVNQTIQTSGAYDWEFFMIGPFYFLAVANTFNGRSTVIDSTIYIWLGGMFQPYQSIKTFGAIDWEMFQIENRIFLAVANSQMLTEEGKILYSINSTIYELSMTSQAFIKFQDIETNSALDWEYFTVGDDKFLVVANSYDGTSYSLNSVIYRWQGYEGFVPVHRLNTNGCRDWEFFNTTDGSYLIYSSARAALSKVLKLRTI